MVDKLCEDGVHGNFIGRKENMMNWAKFSQIKAAPRSGTISGAFSNANPSQNRPIERMTENYQINLREMTPRMPMINRLRLFLISNTKYQALYVESEFLRNY